MLTLKFAWISDPAANIMQTAVHSGLCTVVHLVQMCLFALVSCNKGVNKKVSQFYVRMTHTLVHSEHLTSFVYA